MRSPGPLPARHGSWRGPENQDLETLGDRMELVYGTGRHIDRRTGADLPVFVADPQHRCTGSHELDLILGVRLLVVNRTRRP